MTLDSLPDELILRQPDDWHVHLRDGEMLRAVVGSTARVFRRAIVMPNLNPPITSVEAADAYRDRILAALPKGFPFTPLMTVYLTEDLDQDVLEEGYRLGVFTAAKLYPANATTNSEKGVSDLKAINALLETIEKIGMPLLIHGEVNDVDVDIFDREAVFIEHHLAPIISRFPNLRIVMEHITTQEAVQFVETAEANLAATITPHHLHINRNAMFNGGFRSDFYCLPVAKRERHRLALRQAVTSGKPCFFLGTDSAPHSRSAKESSCSCGGIFNAGHAIESYAEVFEQEGALDRLEAFASVYGPKFYGMPLNNTSIKLVRRAQIVPFTFKGKTNPKTSEHLVPFHAGELLNWSISTD